MSELTKILTSSVDIYYQTALLLAPALVLPSMTADRQPSKSSRLEVTLSGSSGTGGTINVNGNVSEGLTFSGNGVKVGSNDFNTISGIAVDGITDGTIKIRALTKTGQPINQEVIRHQNLPVRFYRQVCKLVMMPPGQEDIATYEMLVAPDKKCYENDIVYAVSGISGITRGAIVHAEDIQDMAGVTFMGYYEVTPI